MKLDIEGKPVITTPTPAQIARTHKSLRSYGNSSYASLTDGAGNYVQVVGSVSYMIERFGFGAQRWRAFHNKPSPMRPDGTILVFKASNIPMRSDEWFVVDQVVEVFLDFLSETRYPPFVYWRVAPGF